MADPSSTSHSSRLPFSDRQLKSRLSPEAFQQVANARKHVWTGGFLGMATGALFGTGVYRLCRAIGRPQWLNRSHGIGFALGGAATFAFALSAYFGLAEAPYLLDALQKTQRDAIAKAHVATEGLPASDSPNPADELQQTTIRRAHTYPRVGGTYNLRVLQAKHAAEQGEAVVAQHVVAQLEDQLNQSKQQKDSQHSRSAAPSSSSSTTSDCVTILTADDEAGNAVDNSYRSRATAHSGNAVKQWWRPW